MNKHTKVPGAVGVIADTFSERLYESAMKPYIPFGILGDESSPKDDYWRYFNLSERIYAQRQKNLSHTDKNAEQEILHILNQMSRQEQVICLEGGPGVGKTTVLRRSIIKCRHSLFLVKKNLIVLWFNLKYVNSFGDEDYFGIIFRKLRSAVSQMIEDGNVSEEIRGLFCALPDACANPEDRDRFSLEVLQFLSREHKVVAVFDDIDQLANATSELSIRSFVNTVLRQCTSGGVFADYFHVVFMALRPQTKENYETEFVITNPVKVLDLCSVDLETAINKRVSYLNTAFQSKGLKVQIVDTEEFKGISMTGNSPYIDYPEYFSEQLPPPSVTWFNMRGSMMAYEHATVFIRDLIQFNSHDGSASSQTLSGARKEEAWAIFKLICGDSMRKAVVLTKNLLMSDAMQRDFREHGTVKAYLFLDTLVYSSFLNKEHEVRFIHNVYDSKSPHGRMCTDEDYLFLPFFFQFLRNQFSPGDIIERQKTLDDFTSKFGFRRDVVVFGLERAVGSSSVSPVFNRDNMVHSYLVDADFVKSHCYLMKEAAYIDNCVNFHSKNDFRVLPKTTGSKSLDLAKRIENSTLFLRWLLKQERTFGSRVLKYPLCLSEYDSVKIPSIAVSAIVEYKNRLTAICRSFDKGSDAFTAVGNFNREFNEVLDMPSVLFPWIGDGK
jgi:hypothetical protein